MSVDAMDRELIANDILGYLKQHEDKDLLRFITCGSVDDGKSTLIGRLLYDSKLIYEDHLAAIEAATGQRNANIIGYCLGGTLLAATLACMRANGDDRVNSATFFSKSKRPDIGAD